MYPDTRIPCQRPDLPGRSDRAGHLAPEAAPAPGVFFNTHTPAREPLTDNDPVCGDVASGILLPRGTSSRRASRWSQFLAWSHRVDRSWTGAILGGVSLFAGAYLLFFIAGVLQ